jgi:hypothetical protein
MLVNSIEDLIENIKTMHSYRGTKYQNFYKGMIGNGVVYVALKVDGEYLFAPSRFVGYKNNNAEKHSNSESKDGGVTNIAISKFMGKERIDSILENEYIKYCDRNGITPSKKQRRYWPLIEAPFEREMRFVEDISEIIDNILEFDKGLASSQTDFYRGLLYKSSSVVALKLGRRFFFAPTTCVGFANFGTNKYAFQNERREKMDNIVSTVVEQEFREYEMLDQKLNEYVTLNNLRPINDRKLSVS